MPMTLPTSRSFDDIRSAERGHETLSNRSQSASDMTEAAVILGDVCFSPARLVSDKKSGSPPAKADTSWTDDETKCPMTNKLWKVDPTCFTKEHERLRELSGFTNEQLTNTIRKPLTSEFEQATKDDGVYTLQLENDDLKAIDVKEDRSEQIVVQKSRLKKDADGLKRDLIKSKDKAKKIKHENTILKQQIEVLKEENDQLKNTLETYQRNIKVIGRELTVKQQQMRSMRPVNTSMTSVATQTPASLDGLGCSKDCGTSSSSSDENGATALTPKSSAMSSKQGTTTGEQQANHATSGTITEDGATAVDGASGLVTQQQQTTGVQVNHVTTMTRSGSPRFQVSNAIQSDLGQVVATESGECSDISLLHTPTSALELSVWNYYKILLLMIAHRLLQDDVVKIREWALAQYEINPPGDVWNVLQEMDKRQIITVKNLTILRMFFINIIRFDLVHLIDCFNVGNCEPLSDVSLIGVPRSQLQPSRSSTRRTRATDQQRPTPSRSITGTTAATQQQRAIVGANAQMSTVAAAAAMQRRPPITLTELASRKPTAGNEGNQTGDEPTTSRPGPDDASDEDSGDDDGPWLCSHYKRKCRVKFSCCQQYWPCHRCHNNEAKCGNKKLKSRNTQRIKCAKCHTEQEFRHRCIKCNQKFAKYFCAICKHLTGIDDKPYHCPKCGICRIHEDRSFHCDVCGVCLDKQLKGNHKCREGSAHDECCICLEDAFTGCQILPCSHKVHKECATQMIRNNITRCPICRESFAHKLERRPIQGPRKPDGTN